MEESGSEFKHAHSQTGRKWWGTNLNPDLFDFSLFPLARGSKLICTGGHISLAVAFKGPNVILGLYKCDYSLTVKRELRAAAR